jgi:hypothetical protein
MSRACENSGHSPARIFSAFEEVPDFRAFHEGTEKKWKKLQKQSCGFPPIRIDHGHRNGGAKASQDGRLAQLVERFVYTEDVGSSSLSSPTILSQFSFRILGDSAIARSRACSHSSVDRSSRSKSPSKNLQA